jgi:cytochrome oxidase Cu insertion factor (SCO1/SenC/PrrC family)
MELISEKIIGPEGIEITLQFSCDPTRETYEFVREYAELRMRALQKPDGARNVGMTPHSFREVTADPKYIRKE